MDVVPIQNIRQKVPYPTPAYFPPTPGKEVILKDGMLVCYSILGCTDKVCNDNDTLDEMLMFLQWA